MTDQTETVPEKIVREHVTTLHLIGEQLSQIESWFWQHLADVRDAATPAVPAPATDQTAPTDWIDGHPQLEAIAAAVWEKCGRSDSGTCVEDDPRNIAVAALAAVLPVSDVGTEFACQADQPDEAGLAAFEAGLASKTGPKADSKPATDRAALSAKLWQIAEHHIVAEWICCEPLDPKRELCAKGYAALGMAKTLLVDSPEAWNPSAPLLDAVLAVLPAPAEEHRVALCDALGLGTGAPWDAICDRAAELALPPLSRDPVAQRLGLLPAPADRAAVYAEVADRLAADAEQGAKEGFTRIYRRSAAKQVREWGEELRRVADETQHPEAETPVALEAPPVCEGFQWIGQSFATCDRCGQPAWEHEGEEVPVEGAGPFDTRRTVRPWEPGQADAIRAKWGTPAAVQQSKEARP